MGEGGALCRPGTLVVKGPASLLGGQFLPSADLLTVPPVLDERMQIHVWMFHPTDQNREKQMLGNGWRGLVWPALAWAEVSMASALNSWGPLGIAPTWGSQRTCDFSRCSQFCFSILMRRV